MKIHRIPVGKDEHEANSLAAHLHAYHGYDRVEVERKEVPHETDDFILCAVLPKGKTVRGMNATVEIYCLGYADGYSNAIEFRSTIKGDDNQ